MKTPNSSGALLFRARWVLWSFVLCVTVYGGLGGCTSPTEPEIGFATDVASFHYSRIFTRRYYEVARVPDSCVCDSVRVDTLIADTLIFIDTVCVQFACVRDTVVDSLRSITTDSEGIVWAQSYRATRHFSGTDTLGQPLPTFDENASIRLVGRLADTLFLDPNSRKRLLVAPLAASASWSVDNSGAITAVVIGEESLDLNTGTHATWHVSQGATADEWYAVGLGRIRYEENDGTGKRVLGTLIAVDQF